MRRRSLKWWKRVHAYLVEVTLLNSFIIFKHMHTGPCNGRDDYLKYRCDLAEELIGNFSSRGKTGRRSREVSDARLDPRQVIMGTLFQDIGHVLCVKIVGIQGGNPGMRLT